MNRFNHEVNIRYDLIQKELEDDIKITKTPFEKLTLTKRFITVLFNYNYCIEWSEHFYDSEPHIDEEKLRMAWDYSQSIELCKNTGFFIALADADFIEENQRFAKGEYTEKELKDAYDDVNDTVSVHEKYNRIQFRNWIEPYFKGNWGMDQKFVDSSGKYELKELLKSHVDLTDRIYISRDSEGYTRIYVYGRDLFEKDLWYIMAPRKKPIRRMKK